MVSCRWAGLGAVALVVAGLAGCGPSKPPEEVVPASLATAEEIREAYQRINPENRVGVVIAVLERENLAAVGDIAVKEFAIGDVLVFIDTSERPIVDGSVVNVTDDALHVRYTKPRSGRREPRVGDLAVRLATP